MEPLAILIALVLVGVNAFFVAAEFALVRVRVTRIEELVAQGARRAGATRAWLRGELEAGDGG